MFNNKKISELQQHYDILKEKNNELTYKNLKIKEELEINDLELNKVKDKLLQLENELDNSKLITVSEINILINSLETYTDFSNIIKNIICIKQKYDDWELYSINFECNYGTSYVKNINCYNYIFKSIDGYYFSFATIYNLSLQT